MKNKRLFLEKLSEISDVLINRFDAVPNLGGIGGIAGIAMFQFYYADYLGSEEHLESGIKMISHSIEKINQGYTHPSYCNGIAGLAWTISHLNAEGYINIDCDELLSPFDDYLHNEMKIEFENGNYDFLHGALGYAFYFFTRYRATENKELQEKYEAIILESIHDLKNLAIRKGDTISWSSFLDVTKERKGANLSFAHGISGIIDFLSRLYTHETFKIESQELLHGGIKFLLEHEAMDRTDLSLFPNWIEENSEIEYNSRIAWCYGDLGIGTSLLRAGIAIDDSSLQKKAVGILEHCSFRRSPSTSLVLDAGFCHGSFGNALIFKRIFKETGNKLFKEAFHFWMEDGLKKSVHHDGFAGYKQWNGLENKWVPKLSLLEGVAGIGLVMVDYLSEKDNNWDQCILIS